MENKIYHFFNQKFVATTNYSLESLIDSPSLVNNLTVDNVNQIVNILANEWYYVLKEKQIDQSNPLIENTTKIFTKINHLHQTLIESRNFFINCTVSKIKEKNNKLGFKLIEDAELIELSHIFLDDQLKITEATELLKSETSAEFICKEYNSINLQETLQEI